jgi:hypothetical protein
MHSAKQNKIQLIQKLAEMATRVKELHRQLGGQGDYPFQVLNESIEVDMDFNGRRRGYFRFLEVSSISAYSQGYVYEGD